MLAFVLDDALVVVGIVGGFALFGFLGIFYGPILMGMVKTVLETVWVADRAGSPGTDGPDRREGPGGPSGERSNDAR